MPNDTWIPEGSVYGGPETYMSKWNSGRYWIAIAPLSGKLYVKTDYVDWHLIGG